jgi:hypothetical protein
MVIRCRQVDLMHPTSGLIHLCSGQIAEYALRSHDVPAPTPEVQMIQICTASMLWCFRVLVQLGRAGQVVSP